MLTAQGIDTSVILPVQSNPGGEVVGIQDTNGQFTSDPQPTPVPSGLPDANQMLAELKASGTLDPNHATIAPLTPPTSPLTAPPPPLEPTIVQLANTTPTFKRPTADNLLEHVNSNPTIHGGSNLLLWLVLLIIVAVLGGFGWMVYSQMRISQVTPQEAMAQTIEMLTSSLNH